MISSFSQYLVEEERTVYFTFGRMNPPTIGHGKLLDKLAASAGRNPYRVYLSQSQDGKKNPLSYSDKVKHVRKMFPKHARSVMINKKIKTAIDAITALYNEGFRSVVFVVGSDRVREFDILLNKYNGQKARHGFYNFKTIKVISAGDRDPDAEGVEGMSASKMRKFVADNDFTSFSQGVPKAMSNSDARKLFNAVRVGMGLKEEKTFKNHIQLEKVSERRELFATGNLFSVSDEVVIKETNDVGVIQVVGANYVIVEFNGQRKRFWLDAVEKIQEAYEIGTPEYTAHAKKMTPGQKEAQDPDIKDREGTQPKRYHAGLKKATKIRRDRHFKKHGKKADNDPSAYKPAPGDADAKTKPSKYTKIVRRMMGESYSNWTHSEPIKYAKHLEKTFGKPNEMTDSQLCWFAKDGFKRIVIKDEYILHGSPAPHYDFIYCYIDLQVPNKFANALAESSGSIMVDYLKGEVGARCGSITANATTLNYVLDVVAGRVAPSKKEYEKRILGMKDMFEKGKKYTTDWWPDESGDADPKNRYYAEGNHLNVCGCSLHENKAQSLAKMRIDREKEVDAKKHDRMMDRARMKDTQAKNKETSVKENSFADKSKASGISVGTLKKVYQRGVAAWKTGHRPGTTPSQWGHARVNAFIAKKKKGNLNHDKDLA